MSNSMIKFVIQFTISIGREGVQTMGQFSFLFFSFLPREGGSLRNKTKSLKSRERGELKSIDEKE